MTQNRLSRCFATLRTEKRSGLITFLTAGDPDYHTCLDLLNTLPKVGADLIEIGMPFSDPMADGPSIQRSSHRALHAGASMKHTLQLVTELRHTHHHIPIILMGYYNPIYRYGVDRFLKNAVAHGVDGLIVVDLPPEADDELCLPAQKVGLDFIRLVTPTTNDQRLPKVLRHTTGFLYYVSISGLTGTRTAPQQEVKTAVTRLRRYTDLPIAVGFGLRTPEHVANLAGSADAVVIGSALVDRITDNLDDQGHASARLIDDVQDFVERLSLPLRAS